MRRFGRVWVILAALRLTALYSGLALLSFADWRQVVGEPVVLLGVLPDGLVVRYLVLPTSTRWPAAMTVSIVVTSGVAAALWTRWRRRRP